MSGPFDQPSVVHLDVTTEYGRTVPSRRMQIGEGVPDSGRRDSPRVVEFTYRTDTGEVLATELCDEWFGCSLNQAEVEAIAAWFATVAADMNKAAT